MKKMKKMQSEHNCELFSLKMVLERDSKCHQLQNLLFISTKKKKIQLQLKQRKSKINKIYIKVALQTL